MKCGLYILIRLVVIEIIVIGIWLIIYNINKIPKQLYTLKKKIIVASEDIAVIWKLGNILLESVL